LSFKIRENDRMCAWLVLWVLKQEKNKSIVCRRVCAGERRRIEGASVREGRRGQRTEKEEEMEQCVREKEAVCV